MIGRTLAHYKITAAIGAGGMGEVFRATDTKLGRAVALKVLPSDMARDPERLARFQREARAIAALNHPHIVTIFSVDEIEGTHFLTMELIEGESLAQLIPGGGLAVERTLAIGAAMADGLAAAHDKGIVHRDLKPANVMMTTDGRVKVLDFGLAKELRPTDPADATLTSAGHTQVGMVMGTPAYMSPEQVAGRPMDHRTDIFSLGILLYQMASGARPFEGATSIELASSILRDAPRPLDELRHDVPADLARLIRRCLEKDPARRVQTARDVANELRDIARPSEDLSRRSNEAAKAKGAHDLSRRSGEGAEADDGFRVAVRPFKYTGANTDLASLGEGLSEEIVTGLLRFSYLRVPARGAAAANVRYVIEGSIRQAGSTIRVAAQLVDQSTGAHLWAETFDRIFRPDDIFALQDELVPRIVSTVADQHGVLVHSMSAVIAKKSDAQLSAHETVLRVFGFHERMTADEHAKVRALLERAVEQTRDDSDCWAMLATLYTDEHMFGFNVLPDPLGRAQAAARRAIELSPSSALASQALAQSLFFRKELQAFRPVAERTMALNPMDGASIAFIGLLLALSGEWERGCSAADAARKLNPHFPGWYWLAPLFHAFYKGDYRATTGFAARVNIPGYFWVPLTVAAASGHLGDLPAAQKAVRELLAIRPDFGPMARAEFEKWFQPDLVESFLDGLRKAGLEIAHASAPGRAAPAAQSIAVLPFANLSADKDQEYFSDGLAEEIINALAQVSGLKVIARTSAFAFRGKEQDIREIASALGVTSVLQGSVRRAGSRIRVATQLINASDGAHLWSERFDRELTEVFAVQDEIAAAIAAALKVKLSGQSATRSHDPNLSAYEAFLKGKHHYYQFSPEHFTSAEQDFARAIEFDSQWAEPHAALGDLYFAMGFYGWRPLEDMIPRARAEARKALDLAPSHPLGHAVLGIVAAHHDYNWPEADDQFRRVGTAEFVHPNVHLLSLFYLLSLGRFDAALDEAAKAIAEDPLNSFWRARRSWVLANANRYDDAVAEATRALELDETNYQARMMLALSHTCQGSLALALEAAEEVYRTSAFDAFGTGLLGGILSRLGEKERAAQIIATMTGAITIGMTMYHLIAGEIDAALDWYQKDIEAHRPNAPMVAFAAWLEPLRASPRWAHVAGLMNLPAASR